MMTITSIPHFPSPNLFSDDDIIDENFIANFNLNAPLTETQYQLAKMSYSIAPACFRKEAF